MEYRRLGKSTLKVSALSLGSYLSFGSMQEGGEELGRKLIRTAYEAGVNSIDCADEYDYGEAERIIGKVIKDYKRSDLVISSKCFWDVGYGPNDMGLSRKHIVESVHESLRNFDTDYIDIYYAHRYEAAVIEQVDPDLEEMVRAFDDLIHQGKILYWGTSCWTGAQLAGAFGLCNQMGLYKPVVEQPEYNFLTRDMVETEIVRASHRFGIGIMTWSPLKNGILTGKYNQGVPEASRLADPEIQWLGYESELTPENIEKVRKLSELAADLGGSVAQLSIAWLLRLPEISSVLLGAKKVGHLEENLKAMELVKKLTPDVLERIEEIMDNDPNRDTVGPMKPDFLDADDVLRRPKVF
jgi:voltage-dependent potassium channel beta subunit